MIHEQFNPLIKEIWKIIPGFERYEASTFGQIRFAKTGKIRKPSVHRTHHGKEYLVVTLKDISAGRTKNGYTRTINLKIGRVVLQTFVGPAPSDKPLCLHNDDDGFNNRLDNLRWGNHAENQKERVNPLCKNCSKKCRLDSHHPDSGQCYTEGCECSGYERKNKTLFVWGKSLEATS